MQSFSSRSFIGKVVSRWLFPAVVRRDAQVLMASPVSANPNQHLDLLFHHKTQIRKLDRPHRCFSSATTQATNEAEDEAAEQRQRIDHMEIMPGISHPYGYKTRYEMKRGYSFDMADRTETPLELDDTTCGDDMPCAMMQIFSLKLARAPTGGGPAVQLYGYLAARDEIDYKLVHVFNRGREDPITVRRGSLIEMTGPSRSCVVMSCSSLT
jgi:hypothetical protein